MRISAISDIHGCLSHTAPSCDVLAICGDITPLWSSAERWQSMREWEWAKRKFIKWVQRQDAKHVVQISGNHDLFLWDQMTRTDAIRDLRDAGIIVLGCDDEVSCEIDGISFSGNCFTPTIQSRNWAYSAARSSSMVAAYLDQLPPCDVLLTHGPPQGILDGLMVRNGAEHVGCSQLMHWMMQNSPRLTLCGHIHEYRGRRAEWFDLEGRQRKIANVCIMDANYNERGAKVQTFDLSEMR